MSDSLFQELDRLLSDERRAVVAADFAALNELAERKESLLGRLDPNAIAPDEARQLKEQAERNGALLAAAARGVRSVLRRVGEIRSANGPLKTYGEDGRQQTYESGSRSLEKRA